MIKKIWSISLVFLFSITLFASNVFACACCADKGHYSISTSKPSKFVFDTLKQLNLTSAKLYANAGYPDNIKGINPLGNEFSIKSNFGANLWNLNFLDNNSKNGNLDLLKPLSMVEYMVDLEPTNEEIKAVNLYKEWRFKYKVNEATGIFSQGYDKQSEYFLVLQGRGNLCTNIDDFKSYRIEITGRKSNFMFFGDINGEEKSNLKLGALKGNYSGCSCSVQTNSELKKSGKWSTFNFYADLGEKDQSGYFNINGNDEKFPLKSKGKQSAKPKIGDKHTDVYEKNGITISLEYVASELPCKECEGTNYDVTITAKRGNEVVIEKGNGSCGC